MTGRTNRTFLVSLLGALLPCAIAAAPVAQDATVSEPLRLVDVAASGAQEAPPAAPPPASSRWSSQPLPGVSIIESEAVVPSAGGGEGVSEVVQVGGSLAGVLLLIFVLRYMIRSAQARSGGIGTMLSRNRAPSGVASILARYPVGRGQQVALLAVGKRVLVVHQSNNTMQTLSEITDEDEIAHLRMQLNGEERQEQDRSFLPKLEQIIQKSDEDDDQLEPVEGMPGAVAETVDLTTKRRRRFVGGVA